MEITFAEIYTKCEMFSGFEGERMTDSKGESLYPVVHITEQDEDLINEYAEQSVKHLCQGIRYAVSSYVTTTSGFTITFVDKSPLIGNTSAKKHITEAVCSYVMSLWLEDKAPERSKSYMDIYANMTGTIARAATHRQKPSLSNY